MKRKPVMKRTVSIITSMILLVLTVVASSMVLYHFINTQSEQLTFSEKSTNLPVIIVENIKSYRGHIEVFVRNIGKEPYTVDRIYVYEKDGRLASTGEPVSPDNQTLVNPGEVKSILFNVGVLPDGTYRISLGGHGSPEAGVSVGKVNLDLTSAIPPIVITEIMDTHSSIPGKIEIYNPTNSPLNISYYEFVYSNDLNEKLIFRIISANPINYTTPNTTSIYIKGLVPQTVVLAPKSYMVINYTGDPNPPYYIVLNKYGRNEFKIYYDNDVIDDTGEFTFYGTTIYSVQRLDLHIHPRWILADPTFGIPNRTVGFRFANT